MPPPQVIIAFVAQSVYIYVDPENILDLPKLSPVDAVSSVSFFAVSRQPPNTRNIEVYELSPLYVSPAFLLEAYETLTHEEPPSMELCVFLFLVRDISKSSSGKPHERFCFLGVGGRMGGCRRYSRRTCEAEEGRKQYVGERETKNLGRYYRRLKSCHYNNRLVGTKATYEGHAWSHRATGQSIFG